MPRFVNTLTTLLVGVMFGLLGSAANATVYTSTNVPLAIPDNNAGGVASTLTVPDSFLITDLDLILNITHTWVGDLQVTLAHGATSVIALDRPGVPASTFGCSGDNISATLSDEAGTPVEGVCGGGTPTITGTFRPNNLLSAFDGLNTSGLWTLTVRDLAAADTGTLQSWSLDISRNAVAAPEPGTLTLIGAGLLGLNWTRRRRKKDLG